MAESARFGESLPRDPPTTLPLQPVVTRTLALRRLITISDLTAYRKLAQTLPAAEMAYLRSRVRQGDVGVIEQLFYAGGPSSERERGGVGVRDNNVGYTWASLSTTWWEKGGAPAGLVPGAGRTGPKGGKGLVLEVGMAVLRCANLRAVVSALPVGSTIGLTGQGVWPPTPEENYRKSHLIVEEWVDKVSHQSPCRADVTAIQRQSTKLPPQLRIRQEPLRSGQGRREDRRVSPTLGMHTERQCQSVRASIVRERLHAEHSHTRDCRRAGAPARADRLDTATQRSLSGRPWTRVQLIAAGSRRRDTGNSRPTSATHVARCASADAADPGPSLCAPRQRWQRGVLHASGVPEAGYGRDEAA